MKKVRRKADRGWRSWLPRLRAFLRRTFLREKPAQPPAETSAPPATATPAPPIVRRAESTKALDRLAAEQSTPTAKTAIKVARRGEWHEDTVTVATGRIDLAPWLLPARSYRVYTPAKLAADPCIVVMLHGCKQTSSEIAEGTRLNEHADDRGWIIVYPEQSKSANKYGCWNWFDPANGRGHGECALIAAMHEAVRARHKIRARRTLLAGMSAGGALVSQLALRYSPQWAGIAIHSGLPFGAATDPWGAQRAMREGAADLEAARELKRTTPDAVSIPAIIMHGNEDSVVHRRNADLLVRQFLGWNKYFPDDLDWSAVPLPPVVETALSTANGHTYTLRDYGEGILPPVRECEVAGMGHAWSGGDSTLPFHDALGPDATALMMEFFSGVAERA